MTDQEFNDTPLQAFRLGASALLTYAVASSVKPTTDQVYRAIVEGRLAPKYSSCGDLAHWFLYRLGVRAPWINRVENKPVGWRVGLNLNLLHAPPVGSCAAAVAVRSKLSGDPAVVAHEAIPDFNAGDVILVSTAFGGHAICVTGAEPRAEGAPLTVHTAEYGQPGGAAKTHVITIDKPTGVMFCGSSQITSYLTLPAALGAGPLAAPDLKLIDVAVKADFSAANP